MMVTTCVLEPGAEVLGLPDTGQAQISCLACYYICLRVTQIPRVPLRKLPKFFFPPPLLVYHSDSQQSLHSGPTGKHNDQKDFSEASRKRNIIKAASPLHSRKTESTIK